MNVLLVFLGGGLGAVSRYLVGLVLANSQHTLPWTTLLVNTIGSFLIAVFFAWHIHRMPMSSHYRLILVTGFLGGFTTFSSFSYESLQLYEQKGVLWMLVNVLFNVVGSILAAFAGWQIVKAV